MVASNIELLSEISLQLGHAIAPSLTSISAASDLFEAYLFSLVLRAAQREGAAVSYENVDGDTSPSTFVFRTSPGNIASRTHPYTHAIISFPEKPDLEVHVGVKVSGSSGVLHECDVAVISRGEARDCRKRSVPGFWVTPRSSELVLAIECKFYAPSSSLLGQARSFIGLVSDLSAKTDRYFVFNISSKSAERLLEKKRTSLKWAGNVFPASANEVGRVLNFFQTTFRGYQKG
jgi:hypothetical protein